MRYNIWHSTPHCSDNIGIAHQSKAWHDVEEKKSAQ